MPKRSYNSSFELLECLGVSLISKFHFNSLCFVRMRNGRKECLNVHTIQSFELLECLGVSLISKL